jgi:hypothetical protein
MTFKVLDGISVVLINHLTQNNRFITIYSVAYNFVHKFLGIHWEILNTIWP